MGDFEFIEHTADVGVRIYGKSLQSLFQNAASVLFRLMVDITPAAEIEKNIVLETENIQELLATWLNELLSLFFAYQFLPAGYAIEIEDTADRKVLKAKVKGGNFDPYANKLKMEIKAATYHELKVEKNDSGWVAEVIFDV